MKVVDVLYIVSGNLDKIGETKELMDFDIVLLNQSKMIINQIITDIENYAGTSSFYSLSAVARNLYKFCTHMDDSQLIELIKQTIWMSRAIKKVLFIHIDDEEIDFNENEVYLDDDIDIEKYPPLFSTSIKIL